MKNLLILQKIQMKSIKSIVFQKYGLNKLNKDIKKYSTPTKNRQTNSFKKKENIKKIINLRVP